MRKIRHFLLLIPLLMSSLNLLAYNNGDRITKDGITYFVSSVEDKTLTVVSTTLSGHVAIPSTVREAGGDVTFTVTGIGTEQVNWGSVSSVTIPNTVVSIGMYAFRGSPMTTLHIPASVENISSGFSYYGRLPNLTSYTVDAANPKYKAVDGVLYSKDGKKIVHFPRAKSCTNNAFTIPSTVDSIAAGAFWAVTQMKTLNIPASVKHISTAAYGLGPNNLFTAISVASANPNYCSVDGVLYTKDMKTLMFYPAAKGGNFTVPADVKVIAPYSFEHATLTSLNTNSVDTIKASALFACNVKTVTIGAGLSTIEQGGLDSQYITSFTVVDANPNFRSVNNVIFSKDRKILVKYPPALAAEKYDIPSGTTEIAEGAFMRGRVNAVTVPATVTKIGSQAFRATWTTSITFTPTSRLSEIGPYAFWASNITQVDLPAAVDSICSGAFINCLSLQKVTVADNSRLKTLGGAAFSGCTSLSSFTFHGSCPLDTIGNSAFRNTQIQTFALPPSVRKIGNMSFDGCTSLTSITWGTNPILTTISDGAFANCGFTSLTLPQSLTTVGREAFLNCGVLESVDFSDRLSDISPEAFKGCYNLQRIVVDKANTTYSSIDGMLLTKDKETLVLFPPGKANDKFTLLAPSIRTIGDYAFYQNERLTNVVIPNRVTSLGRRAFGLCPNLNTLTLLCDNLIDPDNIRQALNEATFDDGNTTETSQFGKISLHLRKAVYDDYKANHENTGDKYDTFYGQFPNIYSSFHPLSNPSVSTTQRNEAEEYIAVSENEVSLIKANSTTDETYVVPETVSRTRTQPYKVGMIGDYAFSGCSGNIKEVVLPGEVSYIGAMAFLSTEGSTAQSSIRRVFLLNATTDAETFSTTRFELDDTGTDYSEFARNTRVYVKKSTFQDAAFQDAVKRYTTSNTAIGRNATPQMFQYKIMDYGSETGVGIRLSNTYGTFAREFDVDLSEYAKELGESVHVVAFTSPRDADSHFKPGEGDGDNKTAARYYVRMTSLRHTMQDGTEVDGTYVPAGTGVLLKVMTGMRETDEEFYYCIGEDGRAATPAASYLVGVTRHGTTIDDTGRNIFGMQRGVFQPLNGATNVTFPAHKAYLKLDGFPGATAGNSAGAKLMFLMGGEVVDPANDAVTSIDGLDEGTGRKDESPVYDLQGRRLSANAALKSGIYVKNGKKFVIK